MKKILVVVLLFIAIVFAAYYVSPLSDRSDPTAVAACKKQNMNDVEMRIENRFFEIYPDMRSSQTKLNFKKNELKITDVFFYPFDVVEKNHQKKMIAFYQCKNGRIEFSAIN